MWRSGLPPGRLPREARGNQVVVGSAAGAAASRRARESCRGQDYRFGTTNAQDRIASLGIRPSIVVEVAGIEPASESLQRAEPTCLSDSFCFAHAAIEPARSMRR